MCSKTLSRVLERVRSCDAGNSISRKSLGKFALFGEFRTDWNEIRQMNWRVTNVQYAPIPPHAPDVAL
jgi:hypothetical protein